MTNELFELASKRRSIRRYTNDHISEEVLNEIMKVALAAPCADCVSGRTVLRSETDAERSERTRII